MWQELQDSLADQNFTVIAVAEESRGAEQARPWVEKAGALSYPCLVDTDHRLAALYGMVNVPQAVWIDEAGRIARPPESAGATDHFRHMDQVTKTMAPDDQAARMATRAAYIQAVRDWVRSGAHALDAASARRRLPVITAETALADAHFRLGVWLRHHGNAAEAAEHLAEASRLHPDSWNMWRQAADLEAVGNAGGPAFWARVQALGDRSYYPPAIL